MLAGFPDCALGSIPPFGELFGIPTVVEEALLEQRDITLPTGDRRIALRMRVEDYVRLANPRLGRFAVHDAQQFPVHPPLRSRAVP